MFKLSVPISSKTINKSNREKYLKQLKEAGVERIFICGVGEPADEVPQRVVESVKFLKSEGFEVGVWIGSLGHGSVLVGAEDTDEKFKQIVTVNGNKLNHAICPLDSDFRKCYSQWVGKIAKTGTDIIMLDDDFRMSERGEELACACPIHLKRIGEILGEAITLDKLRPYVISGKANKYRDAWLKAQEEGLVLLAKDIRAEVDKVSEDITLCTSMVISGWNVGGGDVRELARTLAGKNTPIMRLAGAPYWAALGNYTLVGVIEEARLLASFCQNTGIDLMCEGDVYPRPRYTCPASYLEIYDTAMRADNGYGGILKYMFDYIAGPELETGYLKYHKDNEQLRNKVSEWFGEGANAGVRIISRPYTMKDADLDLSVISAWSPVSFDGSMIANSGIPTIYRGDGVCNSVFGENARAYELSELSKGTMLDAVSAVILTQRGVDVGLKSYGNFEKKNISPLRTCDAEYKSFVSRGNVRFLNAELKDGARAVMFSGDTTVAYTYENSNGERFLVFLFDGIVRAWSTANNSGVFKNYVTADVLSKSLPWVARRQLPAYCTGNPELSLMCRKDGNSMTVAIFNCFADFLINPVIILDEEYKSIECFGCEAKIEGNKVTLTGKLHGFTQAVLRVTK